MPEARRVIGMLGMLPFSWTWEQAESAMQDVATVLEQGIDLADVTRFLEQHRRLEALGFGEPTAVAVAEALGRAGAGGERRDAVLSALIETAGSQADLDALVAEHQRLEASVNELAATEQRWQTAVQQHREHVERLKGAVARLSETQNRLQAERDEAADSLAVANALRAFLMRRTAEAESLWTSLDGLLSWRKRGGRADDAVGHIFTEAIHRKILAFFQKLNQELPRK